MNKFVRKIAIGIACLGLTLPASGQTVQWASQVLEVSSTYSSPTNPNAYSARQALGKPSRLPAVGSSESAWCPALADNAGDEYIKVSFPQRMPIQQVAVAENFGAGSITKVLVFDPANKPHVVYENKSPGPVGVVGRMSNFFFPMTAFPVSAVMVVLKTSAVPDYNHIDAIGISDSPDSIRSEIRLAEGMPVTGERVNLGENVNSTTDDLCPVISPDGKTLYFTRQGHAQNIAPADNQDIWFSRILPDGSFSPAENIGEPLNNKENSSVTSVTPDGNTLLLLNKYYPDGSMEKGISITRWTGSEWGFPISLDIEDFYNDNMYGEYCLSASGKQLIMTMQRKDSYGGKDLYVSFLKEDGKWTAPLHMGPQLNTGAGETSPFLAADGVTLYFSTDGLPGYGKKDMFITRRLDESWTNWSEPENLGPALNTPGWDAYYSIPASGEYAYFVSYTNSIGASDIFRAKLPEMARPKPVVLIKGRVLSSKTNLPLSGEVRYERLSDGKELGIANSNPLTGEYSIVLPAGEDYGFLANATNHISVSQNLDLSKLTEYKEITQDLYLVPIEAGATIRLNNLFFDSGKFDLRPSSISELNRLVKILESNPAMVINIVGHTDDVGSDASNLTLSQNRSKAVKDFLLKKGIAATRLKSQGMGETKPQVPNTSPENRQVNRRIEFTIESF